jgi:hypothetical protein
VIFFEKIFTAELAEFAEKSFLLRRRSVFYRREHAENAEKIFLSCRDSDSHAKHAKL